MNKSWFVLTNGDPLGAIQTVLSTIWETLALDGFLVQSDQAGHQEIIHDPAEISSINPFKPLMTHNAAKDLPQFLGEHPDLHLGTVLRPCENRALVAWAESDPSLFDKLTIIGIDCMGTYPTDDYSWRIDRSGSPENLSGDSLKFTGIGRIPAYRFRPACQVCPSPIGDWGVANIGVIGLPASQIILVSTSNTLEIDGLSRGWQDAQTNKKLLAGRERIIEKLLERNHQTQQRVLTGLAGLLPEDLDALVDQFQDCGPCQECLTNCPICAAYFPTKNTLGAFEREDVLRWIVSCAGCGMCEANCPQDIPLYNIFTYIREQLTQSSIAN
jgi:formate dehydrogenase subunit beta